ncbi:MAG: hypothetical protein HXS46_09510 [Theionarchaea archaeon]|nr:hypothetical protein [Theionarchaea archaeon]
MNRNFLMITVGVLFISGCVFQRSAEETVFPGTQWTYFDLPELTNEQRLELALEAKAEGNAYYQRAVAEAEELSQNLEEYIYTWLDGEADALLPEGLLPSYIDNAKTHSWRLVHPEEIAPEEQWYAMEMYDPREELHQHSPDPHATYLKLIFIAPFGSKLLIEGDFPHCRFTDYQILQPFDPYHPVTGNMGVCEVPIVDVDIEPDPGHVNPFRVGADRTAQNRHYHLTFELEIGNAVDLNPVMSPPEYRAQGNTRVGSPFGFAGPWGDSVLVPSVLWLRIYAPDRGKEPYGGVEWPKAVLQLPTGEKFWITCDKTKAVHDQTAPVPHRPVPRAEPYPFQGPTLGWFKMFGIDLVMMEANAYMNAEPWGANDISTARKEIRDFYRLFWNRGANADPPGNYECGATCCNYISYLVRSIALGKNKVIVITGTLPEFPKTRNSEPIMTSGEVRYFSITHQQGSGGLGKSEYTSVPHGSLMDDEIVVNENNEYIIVFSREEERPHNARRENGVTWQEWGPSSRQGLVFRWMSVIPDWYFPEYAPHETNIPWSTGAWSQDTYDKSLVGENRPGIMGPYHPVMHYMTTEEFEALGEGTIDPGSMPEWIYSKDFLTRFLSVFQTSSVFFLSILISCIFPFFNVSAHLPKKQHSKPNKRRESYYAENYLLLP